MSNWFPRFALVLLLLYIAPMAIWWFVMTYQAGYVMSYENASWGAFGSFVGGTLSPIFSLVSIIYIVQSMKENRVQNELLALRWAKEDRKQYLIKLSELFRASMDRNTEDMRYGLGSSVPDLKPTVRANLYHYNHQYQLLNEKSKELWFGIIGNLTCNAESAFHSTLDTLLTSHDDEELEELLQLVWAAYDINDMVELLNFSKKGLLWGNLERSTLLDKLVEINVRTKFFESWAVSYERCFEPRA